MGTDIPKQFLPVGGKPVLMRTIERFHEYDENMNIILVLPKEQQAYWRELCEQYHFTIEHHIANGGASRFQSSKNGLALIPEDAEGFVAVHDGVRPFVSLDTIKRCFGAAEESYAAIPVMPVTSTLRYVDPRGGGNTVDRSMFREVQTPQVFDIDLLRGALKKAAEDGVLLTDDCSAVERLGMSVKIVEGDERNLKITTAPDLKIAELFLEEML